MKITRKHVFVWSGLATIIFFVLDSIGTFRLCGAEEYGDCMDRLHGFLGVFIPILPLFFFSLVTYKMRKDVYEAWFNFALWWIPTSMLLILITPSDDGGAGIGLSFGKPDVAFLSSFFFIVISTILIIYKYMTLKKKK